MINLSLIFLIILSIFSKFTYQNTICLPERRNFKVYYPCEHPKAQKNDRMDMEAMMRGEPSEFARSGFYDRMFRQANLPQVYDDKYINYPNYGYNPNLQLTGPYRYSNWYYRNNWNQP
ncbi:unnamed protein product [Caenorhabditis angaria]|uniref:Uncharacterized protein n=1 Tax=Caenorhabditis angaria TaxID=860376 RepID=A0A9P1IUT7_9PELO|nr:unnamed protein product [Caenorhabditis angaria]